MKRAISGIKDQVYATSCDTLYFDEHYKAGFGHLAPNSIISSAISAFEFELRPKVLGIKYVTEGLETYWLKGKRYRISSGKYLLLNGSVQEADVVIKNTATRSLCINIEPRLLNEILLEMQQPDNLDDQERVVQHLLSPELFVREATAGKKFQKYLNGLFSQVAAGSEPASKVEAIYEVTNLLVQENLDVIRAYYQLNVTKLSTRQELFHRLLKGKEMLDDSVFSDVSIAEIAGESCLSEFRFYRLFRQCFGFSPYHYLFRRRIEKGLELRKQNLTWNEIAYQLNFTDLAAFSKGFKKITGVSPSQYSF